MKTRIIVDSTSDLMPEARARVSVVPLTVHFGDEEFIDGVTIDHKTFYEKLLSNKELPTTSLIPPGQFQAAFEKAREAGETVIAVVLSSKLSGTYQSAVLAAQEFDNVYVVDSMNATLGEQILVKYALQLAEQGLSAQEVVAELERSKSHVNLMGLPGTLEFLRRGGRMSKTIAVLGSALSIKPVLRLVDGVVVMVGKARGFKNGYSYLSQEVTKSGVDFTKPLCLGYTGLSDALLQRYIEDSRAIWEGKIDKLPISTVGATIGTHVGPDAVIVSFFDNQP